MFRYDTSSKSEFDGKIGIFPLVEEGVALRSSKNRPRGARIIKNIESIDQETYKRFLIDDVFPAIRAKWPKRRFRQIIYVQQDNAKPHIDPCDPEIVGEGISRYFEIRLIFQPAHSPDLNVLDLGFFASIQALQYKEDADSNEELIEKVDEAFNNVSCTTLDNTFVTLQKIMECIMECEGRNDYKLPHIGKSKLRKAGKCLRSLTCNKNSYDKGAFFLTNSNSSV
jgi:hypothetical protein